MTDHTTPIAQIVEALSAAQQFIANGIELGYIRMPDRDTPDSAHRAPHAGTDRIRPHRCPEDAGCGAGGVDGRVRKRVPAGRNQRRWIVAHATDLAREKDRVLLSCIGHVLDREWSLDELRGRLFVVRGAPRPGWETWLIDDDSGTRRELALIGPVELVQHWQKMIAKCVIHPLVTTAGQLDPTPSGSHNGEASADRDAP